MAAYISDSKRQVRSHHQPGIRINMHYVLTYPNLCLCPTLASQVAILKDDFDVRCTSFSFNVFNLFTGSVLKAEEDCPPLTLARCRLKAATFTRGASVGLPCAQLKHS